MSRSPHRSITVLVFSLMVVIAAVQQAAGQPRGAQELADRYKEIISELETIPIDSGELLEQSNQLARELDEKLQKLKLDFDEVAARPANAEDGSLLIVKDHKRVVAKDGLIPLVQSLGEVSLQIHAARHWMEVALRGERKGFWDARVQDKLRNRAEVERAYRDYHAALLIRQDAMNKLAALFSGRAKVVAQLSSPGGGLVGQRDATPEEAYNFASGLHATATSPIFVLPPQFMKTKDIFAIANLQKLEDQQPALVRLSTLVDAELTRLADVHTAQVEYVLNSKVEIDRLPAIVSLGRWNGALGAEITNKMLLDARPIFRDAGLTSLRRLRLDADAMDRWAKKHLKEDVEQLPHEDVRIAIARLASEEIHEPKKALQVLRPLFSDESQAVRKEAYEAVDRLQISQIDEPEVYRSLTKALESQKPPLVCDAIGWMSTHNENTDEKFLAAKKQRLDRLSRHKNDQIRMAATNAFVGSAAWSP